MEFTYSLTREQMKIGLQYYLLWRFFGLRVAYSLFAVLLAAGSCFYGLWSSHLPFLAASGFLLLTILLLWLMPFSVQNDFSLPKEETVRFLSRGMKLNGRARLISYKRYIKFALEKKGLLILGGKHSTLIVIPCEVLGEQLEPIKQQLEKNGVRCHWSKKTPSRTEDSLR